MINVSVREMGNEIIIGTRSIRTCFRIDKSEATKELFEQTKKTKELLSRKSVKSKGKERSQFLLV